MTDEKPLSGRTEGDARCRCEGTGPAFADRWTAGRCELCGGQPGTEGDARARLVARLENFYDFQCEGGPLRNCVEWQQLKDTLAALDASPEPPRDLCPHCHTGKNSPDHGGNDRCFHCDSCGYIGCMWTDQEKREMLSEPPRHEPARCPTHGPLPGLRYCPECASSGQPWTEAQADAASRLAAVRSLITHWRKDAQAGRETLPNAWGSPSVFDTAMATILRAERCADELAAAIGARPEWQEPDEALPSAADVLGILTPAVEPQESIS